MESSSRPILKFYILLATAFGLYEAVVYSFGGQVGHALNTAWALVSALVLILWVEVDSRKYKQIYRPFEFGFLIIFVWPFYLLYYLFRTRRAYAVLWLIGFLVVANFGYALQWSVYIAR